MRGLKQFLLAACVAGLAAASASGQSFNSFTDATVNSGFLFEINGTTVTDLSTVGTDGTYTVGFLTPNTPISLTLAPNSSTLGSGTVLINEIAGVYLISKSGVVATLSSPASISDYNHNAATTWNSDFTAGSNFPGYRDSGGFSGGANSLKEGSGTTPAYGTFSFTNISSSDPIYLGLDASKGPGQTGFVRIASLGGGGGGNPVPTPNAALLMVAGGFASWIGVLRRRRA